MSLSPPSRPIPPTPARMMAASRVSDHGSAPIRVRQVSKQTVSAIPRPLSGTQRKVTSLRWPDRDGEALGSDSKANDDEPDHHQISIRTSDSHPPGAFNLQRGVRSQSDPMLQDQPDLDDLSDAHSTIPIRPRSTRQASIPNKPVHPVAGSKRGNKLPKSHTLQSLVVSHQEIVSHRLMQPIEPPQPITKPCEPNLRKQSEAIEGKLDIHDALSGSRMTQDEITTLNQGRQESRNNRQRLKTWIPRAYMSSNHSARPKSPSPNLDDAAVLKLSANDVANTRRIEEQRRNTVGGRPLFIINTLAQFHRNDPYQTTLNEHHTRSSSSNPSPGLMEDLNDPRLVSFRSLR